MRGVELSMKIVGVPVCEPYDKKLQLLTVLLTPDYKELIFKYKKYLEEKNIGI